MTDPALLARIDRLESRHAIAELVALYCKACDDRDVPLLRSLFTADAVIRSHDGMMNAEGIDAVMTMYAGRFAVLGLSVHWTHDAIVRFDDGDPDAAAGEVFCHAEAHRAGTTLVGSLRYGDAYRREGGRWMFARRLLAFGYYVPVTEYAEAMGSPLRQRAYGDRRPADYPETLASWAGWRAHFPG
ncbi:MAG: nuclear transport factor 2 family protein [Gemmobacter sp.]